jgi:AraC-like DNA-binding protein/mannose-6-phosphate isomerase-like protein (cupin superfamily)
LTTRQTKTNLTSPGPRFVELNQLAVNLRLGSYESAILAWGFYQPRYWRNYLHTHSFFEICYAYQGIGTFRMRGENYPVKTGNLFIAKPGEDHEIVSSRRDPLGIYYWSYSLKPGKSHNPADASIDMLLQHFAGPTPFIVGRVPAIATTLKCLTDEISRRSVGYPLAIEGLTTKLILDTARAVVRSPIPNDFVKLSPQSEAATIVETAGRYIRDNLSRNISLRDVAAQVHVSERHLGRLFNQVRQTTVLDCITRTRIEEACRLLLNQNWAVKKAAASVGYPDVRYFTTLFRKQMNITPAVFRNRRGTAFLDESRRGKYL